MNGSSPDALACRVGGFDGADLSYLSAKMSVGTASPREGSSFSGSSQGLDTRRLEDYLFGINEQVNEQLTEQVRLRVFYPQHILWVQTMFVCISM